MSDEHIDWHSSYKYMVKMIDVHRPRGGEKESTSIWVSERETPVPKLQEISILERFSSIGLVAGQCFVLLIFVLAVPHWSQLPGYLESQPFVRWDSFPVAMGIAVFCNEGMVVMSSEVPMHFFHIKCPQNFMAWRVVAPCVDETVILVCPSSLS